MDFPRQAVRDIIATLLVRTEDDQRRPRRLHRAVRGKQPRSRQNDKPVVQIAQEWPLIVDTARQEQSLQEQQDFWTTTLLGAPELSTLHGDRPRGWTLGPAREDVAVAFDAGLKTELEALARAHGVALHVVLLAGWVALLSRLSGQADLVVGMAEATRPGGVLAVRLDLSAKPAVAELLALVDAQVSGARDNADISIDQLAHLAGLPHKPSHHPLFQTLLALERDGEDAMGRAEPACAPHCDLVLHVREGDGQLAGTLSYATDLFERESVERVAGYLAVLLRGMASDAAACVARIPVLSDPERRLVLETWNATGIAGSNPACIHALFEEQVARNPGRDAVACDGTRLTYGELNARANRIAHQLRSLGVARDGRVAIGAERGPGLIVGMLAVLKAGGCYVPLDPRYPEDRLRFMLADSGATVLLKNGDEPCAWAEGVCVLDLDGDSSAWPEANPGMAGEGPAPDSLAYVIYTSGSTGTPKAVMVEHRNLSNLLSDWTSRFEAFRDNQPFRASMWTSPSFDVSVFEVFATLATGGTLHVVPEAVRVDPPALLAWFVEHGIGFAYLPPFFVRGLKGMIEGSGVALPFRHLLVGVEPLPEADLHWLQRRTPGLAIVNGYGPTETTVFCTAYQAIADRHRSAPIGRPLANARIYILDGDGQPVPIGAPGEIHVGGAGVARGYLGRPQLTAERFVADPFVAGARMYRTGDLGRWLPDGTVEFLGRNDVQLKVRGFRIEPGEIEARLAGYPGITEAVVLARDDAAGHAALVAYCAGSGPLDVAALRRHLSERMPDYMVPAAFVQLDRLPLTPNGKLDARRLPAPRHADFATRAFEPPCDGLEAAIATIWCDLLKVERVGRHDGFLELGGHSLLAIQAISRLRHELGVDVPLRALASGPTLARFTEAVASAGPAHLPAVTRRTREEREPPSFAQQRLWFLAQVDGASAAYHLPFGWTIRGPLDATVLRRALERIVERHDALRTTFAVIDGKPVQCIAAPGTRDALRFIEQHAASEQEVARLADEEATLPFDLERGPLVRARLVHAGPDRHTLLVTMHHIVSDGWSMRVFMRELNLLYAAFLQGKDDPLPALEVEYADYAAWQRRWLGGQSLQAQADYWKHALGGAPELLSLPLDHPRPPEQDFAGARIDFVLDAAQAQALQDLGARHGATPFATFLAAWAALLSRLSGEDDVVVGTPTANRGRAEIEGLIGFFVNTLALRVDLSRDPTVAELLQRVGAGALAAQEHQDLPFEQVVELLNPARSRAYSPLFQVMFAWEDDDGLRLQFPGAQSVAQRKPAQRNAQFDLILTLRKTASGIEAGLEYATSLFERGTIERIAGYYQALLSGMAADPRRPIADIPILPAHEHDRLVRAWNATGLPDAGTSCIHALFEAQVRRTPGAVAVVHADQSLDYATLNARANRLAHRLRALGAGPDKRVAIRMERGPGMIIAALAVLKAGGAYVPLDPASPAGRVRQLLADSGAVALLVEGDDAHGAIAELAGDLPVVDLASSFADCPDTDPGLAGTGVTPAHLAYVIYTSGSTGAPKGVMVEHRNLVASTRARHACYGDTGRFLLLSPPYFDSSVAGIFGTLTGGGTLVIAGQAELRDPARLHDIVQRQHIDTLLCVPSLYANYLDFAAPRAGDARLARVIVAGEPCPPALVRKSAELQPQAVLYNEYGPTEATVWATVHRCTAADAGASVPIGRPVPGARIYILDARDRPVPTGVAGHIHIGGGGVARGYLDRPELTAGRFVADPFGDDPTARMYRTGDLGRWRADGTIEFLGRNDFQLKIRGFRIEPGEIEAALAAHPRVREVAVVARAGGAGAQQLVAYVVADEDACPPGELWRHLAQRVPDYMLPSAYVRLPALPLTRNGKLDRNALPAPDPAAYPGTGYAAPEGDVERLVASIWSSLLKVERVGRHDGFFALGGHSLLVAQVVSRLREALGVEVPVNALFATPVLADFASAVAAAAPARSPRITKAERGDRLPLSFAQRRLWFLAQMGAGSAAYNIPYELRLRGCLDEAALRHALDRIVARHEALRTTFVALDGEPVQRVGAPGQGFPLAKAEASAPDDLARLAQEEEARPFDLEHGPLARGLLVRKSDQCHTLLVTMHHIVSDGWSMRLFAEELAALYSAGVRGEADPLPPLDVQYADYALWERALVSDRLLDEQADYWKRALAGAPQCLALPTDHARPSVQDFAGGTVAFRLDPALASALQALGARHGTTMFMTLLAGWAALLSRFSGQDDIVVGTPTAHRGHVEIERLIGFFVNSLALRVDLSGEPTVVELLARVKARTLEARQHQDIPFEQVVEQVNPPRSLAYNPLFQAMFAWERDDRHAPALAGLAAEPRRQADYGVSKFDLTLTVKESAAGLEAALEYATALFDRSTIERIAGCYRALLEGMVADDALAVSRLPLLPAQERMRIVDEWNATETRFPSDRCIHELFEEQARAAPASIALETAEGSWSYAELDGAANRLAHRLRALGVQPDDRVAICVGRGADMVIGVLGVLKAGAAYVPLDPNYPRARLEYIVADSAPALLLVSGARPDIAGDLPVVDIATARTGPEAAPSRADAGLLPTHLAYVIYTSGSTGQPKGVMVEHRSACNLVAAQAAAFDAGHGSRVLQFASFSFDACVFEMLLALCSGATLVVPAADVLLAGDDLIRTIDAAGITHALLPPAVLAAIPPEHTLPSLRVLVAGGDVLAEDVARRWAAGRRLFNAYGPTEITVAATLHPCAADAAGAPPIGRPIANTRIYVLDAHRQPVPVGVAGELYIAGAGVTRGYLHRPELTAERFVADTFCAEADARMYRTGDLGRWRQDGTLEFLGRNDFQVKIRGFRVELGEIEARLREHPGITEAAVLAREDIPGDKRLVAYCAGTGDLDAGALRARLRAHLPDYMVPAAFVRLEALPLDPNGKLDRKALPAPEGGAYGAREHEAPRGDLEATLAALWSELLGVARVGRHDDFFALGGHSLLTVKVVARLRAALGVDVPVGALFAHPTLAEFARCVADAAPSRLPPVTKAERGALVPASFAQRRQWFLAQMDGAATAYHVPYALQLRGPLDVPALRRALDRIVARHESLRTTFVAVDGEPQQRIAPAEASRFPLVERTASDAGQVAQLVHAEVMARFDLERGPLARGLLVREADGVHTLLVTLHHIVSDGWSMGVFVRELGALYGAFVAGGEDPLPPLALHYADYAVWQRTWQSGDSLAPQAAYWKDALAGAPELLTLPTDHPRPPEQRYAGGSVPLELDAALTQALKDIGQRHGTTPFMTLLAGWAALLSRLAGQDDVVVGTPTANRGRAEIEGLIGFFVNTLALRLDLSGDPTVAAFLQRVKACSLGAQEHQDIPFEQVVELVNPARSLSHGPLFQAAFSWESDGVSRPALPGIACTPSLAARYDVSKFDLSLSLRESEGRFEGALEYATALFERDTIERIAGYYRELLRGMVADAARPIGAIPILPAAERRLLTTTWNDTAFAYPDTLCLHELFEARAASDPEAIAVSCNGRRLRYAELDRRANQLAHRLRSLGLRPDDRVAICMERELEMPIALLGTLKAGGAYVAMDPAYPQERLRHILADSAPVALLTRGALPDDVADLLDGSVPVLDLARGFDDQPGTRPGATPAGPGATNLAYVIYTSGSTGTPKGVMVEHRNVVNLLADWLRRFDGFGKGAPLQASLWTSFSFDVSVFELFLPLAVGGTVHVVPDDIRGEPNLLFDWFVRERIAFAYLPPFFVRQMDALMAGSDAPLPFEHLLVGVEPLLEAQLHRIQSARPGKGIRIVNAYGPTETTVFSTSYEDMREVHRNAPIGRPIGNTRIHLLDAHLQPVPVGVAGELYIAGAGVARGYMNLPRLTAERFLDDPFGGAGERMYRTGDLARRLPDGNLEFVGRNDQQVKIRGFRIEPGEIETCLVGHPAIREAVVVPRDDAGGDKMLVAYYVGSEDLPADALRGHLAARLPKYMVPAAFVRMQALPLLPSGKLDARALPAPELAPTRAGSAFVAPRDEHELRVAAIWSEVLGIPDIGIDDNFFDLGGESFKAFRVVGRIGGIGVTELFKYPTVRQLAERIAGGRTRPEGLLHELTRPVPAHEKTLTLVCIPFPGGGPISYQPLAREMPRGCTVLGLELPGHDYGRREEQPLPIDEIARRCADEIQRDVSGPIAIYGHCAGGALTIALAVELERRGVDIARLFIGGHFPTPHLPGKVFAFLRRILPIHRWASQRSAFDILKSFGFFDEITDRAQQEFVMANFVREHQEIEDFYTGLYGAPFGKLRTPITSVIGEMDRATELYEERYHEWEYFSRSVDVATIPKAGHYFIKHQPGDLARIIEGGVAVAHDSPGDGAVGDSAAHAPERPVEHAPAAKAARPGFATFFTVAIGEIVSVVGSTLTSFALGVWVYQQTGLVSTYALLMVFVILPAIALSPVAGTLADRVDRKGIMVASNCLAGLSTVTAAVLIWTGNLRIWEVYAIAGATAVANAFRLPAYGSLITQIVPKRYYGKANGFVQLGTGMGTFIGPALAGALMGLIGLHGIVLADFATFVVALSTLLAVRLPDTLFPRREEPFLKEMVGGWHYIIKRHSLVAMIVMVTVANYFVGLIESLLTPLVLVSGNPQSLGFVMASNGAGILAGSALMSLWGGTQRRINGILASTVLAGLCIAIAGIAPATLVQAGGMFGFGFALALVNAHWISTVQTKVGLELQGRVMATNFMLMEAMVPLGYLSAGPLADRVFEPLMAKGGAWAPVLGSLFGAGAGRGIGLILVLSGLFVALWAVAAFLYRPIRCLEDLLPDARADEVIEADKDKLQEKADLALLGAR